MPHRTRAAAYVRMSDDSQNFSIEHQLASIQEYATVHGFEIVRVFADPGRSGLHIKGRAALQDLLALVVSNRADFTTLLVLDVNRWGRFQDTDESAYYEYTCRRHGVHVVGALVRILESPPPIDVQYQKRSEIGGGD